MRNRNKLLLLTLAFVSILMVTPLTQVKAVTGQLTPSAGSGLVDTPVDFKCSGLVAAVSYDVRLDLVVIHTALVASSSGIIIFSMTVSVAGFYSVTVVNTTTTDVVASATLVVNDLVADIMPYIVLFVTITILFGVVAKLKID